MGFWYVSPSWAYQEVDDDWHRRFSSFFLITIFFFSHLGYYLWIPGAVGSLAVVLFEATPEPLPGSGWIQLRLLVP
jgi:hypothetical protein